MTETQNRPLQREVTLAGIFERLFAFVIDYLPVLLLIFIGSRFLTGPEGYIADTGKFWALVAACHLLFVLYVLIFSTGYRRTFGKFLMGIRVVKNDASALSFKDAFLRVIGYYIGIVAAFIPFALAIITPYKKALQDYMAGTIVISERQKTPAEFMVTAILGTMLMCGMVYGEYYSLFKAPAVSDKTLVFRADGQLEQIAFLQDVHRKTYGYYTPELDRIALISGDAVRFQRDMQRNLRRKGFKMGVNRNSFKIEAVAKDKKETRVAYDSAKRG